MSRENRLRLVVVVLLGAALLAGCGGGGGDGGGAGGGGGGTTGVAAVASITVEGASAPIHQNGIDNPGGLPGQNVYLNGIVTITFKGSVDPASVPAFVSTAPASIELRRVATGAPVAGRFFLDPNDDKVVVFEPMVATGTCQAGFEANTAYLVRVQDQTATSAPAVNVDGRPIERGALATFLTRSCGQPGVPAVADRNGGPPNLLASTPAAGSSVSLSSLANGGGSRISLDFDEVLDPASVTTDTIHLVNRTVNPTTNVSVPVTVSLMQPGSVPGLPDRARILVDSATPLADGYDYALRVVGVSDLAGNAIQIIADDLRFGVIDDMNGGLHQFRDDFDDTNNLGSTTGSISWPGTVPGDPNSGRVGATLPVEIIGNGLDGVGSFTATTTINADTQLTPGDPTAQPATYNFTTLLLGSVSGGTTLTFQSTTDAHPGQTNWPLRFRATSIIDVSPQTTINCNGRQNPTLGGGSLASGSNSIPGGWGGPGGGRGGTASPTTDGVTDDEYGLPGEGAHTDPNDPNRPGGSLDNVAATWPVGTANAFFGGGSGGQAGFGISNPTFSSYGGAGGGGGTASGLMAPQGQFSFQVSTAGETRLGSDGFGAGAPAAGQRGQSMAYMIPPLIDACGGSGGGAGGDRRQGPGNIVGARCGGAGGGGGGGIRLTAGGDITIGLLAAFNCAGGDGGRVTVPAGFGGGGSGGSILIQSFADINLAQALIFNTRGGKSGDVTGTGLVNATLDGEGGQGGSGVVQLEDANANFVTAFGTAMVNGETLVGTFTTGASLQGMASSKLIDTQVSAPDYTTATAAIFAGASGTVTVRLIGIAEDPLNPGQPAMTAVSNNGQPLMIGPVDLGQIDQLDGFRWFQFLIDIDLQNTQIQQPSMLPYLESIQVDWMD